MKHYEMMSCEDLGLISFLFCLKARYRIDCLLAHSVIDVNGGRPPLLDYDLLVLGGRPKAALADERLIVAHSFFNACSPWYTKPHQLVLHVRPNHGLPAFI